MNDERTTTVAFSGHRTYRGEADERLQDTIEELYAGGFRTFLCGMAVGFDMAAAEAVVAARRVYSEIALIAVKPFEGQHARFSVAERERFVRLTEAADRVVCLAPVYRAGCYAARNNFLIDHAALLVAWYDGSSGGTRYTVRRALRQGLELVNLYRDAERDRKLF